MRRFITFAVIGLGMSLGAPIVDVGTSFAGEISRADFKKIMIGNTLQRKFWSNRRGMEIHFMYHFIDDKEILFSSGQSAPTQTQDWSYTDEGKFCYIHTYRTQREFCYDIIRIDGNSVVWKTSRGREEKIIFLKG